MQQVVCPECSRMVTAPTRVSFFGFPKLHCPTCRKVGTLPLSSGRWTAYAVIAGLAVVWTIVLVANGGVPVLGVIPAMMIAALVINQGVKRKHVEACARWEELKRQAPSSFDPSGRVSGD